MVSTVISFMVSVPIRKELIPLLLSISKSLTILGNGGFSKAVQYTCNSLNITVTGRGTENDAGAFTFINLYED